MVVLMMMSYYRLVGMFMNMVKDLILSNMTWVLRWMMFVALGICCSSARVKRLSYISVVRSNVLSSMRRTTSYDVVGI